MNGKNTAEIMNDEQLTELLKGLDDEITVPESAQLMWRSRARSYARGIRVKKQLFNASRIAAALVLAVGVGFAVKNITNPVKENTGKAVAGEEAYAVSEDAAMRTYVFVESDGTNEAAKLTFSTPEPAAGEAVAVNVKIYASEPEKAADELNRVLAGLHSALYKRDTLEDGSIEAAARVRTGIIEDLKTALDDAFEAGNLTVSTESYSVTDEAYDEDALPEGFSAVHVTVVKS